MNRRREYDYKVVIVGDSFVGKTTMLKKYLGIQDLRADIVTHTAKRNGQGVVLQIHDTMGQERYRSLTMSYYRGAHGCLVCFNVMNCDSFGNVKQWLYDLRDHVQEDIPKVLVGIDRINVPRSIDSRERRIHEEMIPKSAIDVFCTEHKMQYMYVDIRNTSQIEHAFDVLVDLMLEHRRSSQEMAIPPDIVVLGMSDVEEKSSCYC